MAVSIGTYASIPGSPSSGDLYFLTDSFYTVLYYNGASWDHLLHGKKLTTPPSFTWINQGTATVTTTNGGEYILAPAQSGGPNIRLRKRSAPSTPYTVTIAILAQLVGQNFANAGFVWRQSSDGKLITCGIDFNTNGLIAIRKYTSPTSYNSDYLTVRSDILASNQAVFVRAADNGTNRLFSISCDGINFIQIHSVGRTDFLTADEIGWFVNVNNASFNAGATLIHWLEA